MKTWISEAKAGDVLLGYVDISNIFNRTMLFYPKRSWNKDIVIVTVVETKLSNYENLLTVEYGWCWCDLTETYETLKVGIND